MPIVRVPVVHKFGIVSVARAEQLLQEGRRGKRDTATPRSVAKTAAPTKISQSFIEKYNGASDAEQGKLDRIIHRALSQAKYKAGLHKYQGTLVREQQEGEGRVCDAWLELILLCQCYGAHQEDVLLALATSLNHAPISSVHIPSLLYMCGLCYQWLKSDISVSHTTTSQLRTGELMLLRILYLISVRLYCHQMIGALQDVCTREDIRQLKFDLEGFESRERVYRNFPEALLHWKVALEVGQIVVERNSPAVLHEPSDPSTLSPPPHSPAKMSSSHSSSAQGVKERERGRVGEVSSLLKHTLSVWRAVRDGQGQLETVMRQFSTITIEFSIDNWMESLLAINILCLASQLSLPVMTLLHSLTATLPSSPHTSPPHHHKHHSPNTHLSSPHSASLFRDTPTVGSQLSQETASCEDSPQNLTPAKKGTRFMLPGPAETGRGWGVSLTPDMPVELSVKHTREMDTLNVTGLQPSFREPCTESVYSEDGHDSYGDSDGDRLVDHHSICDDDTLPAVRAGGKRACGGGGGTESEPAQSSNSSSVGASSRCPSSQQCLQELDSTLTVGKTVSLSQSLSPWLKSSISRNLELSRTQMNTHSDVGLRDQPTLRVVSDLHEDLRSDTTCGTPIGEKLEGLESTLIETDSPTNRYSEYPALGKTLSTTFPRHLETRCTHYTHSSSALSGGAGVPGSHVAPSTVYRQSLYSPLTVDMEDDEVDSNLGSGYREHDTGGGVTQRGVGLDSWPSEVGLAYTLGMGEIAVYGRTSSIQFAALEGSRSGEGAMGLRKLAEFSLSDHSLPGEQPECMAWAVRHCAVLGLSRVCRANRHIAVKDGLGGVAWSLLMENHSSERDSRVLEAYKISQVYPDIDSPLLAMDSGSLSSPMLAHLADQLATTLLPPPTEKSPAKSPPRRARPKLVTHYSPSQPMSKVKTYHKGSSQGKHSHTGYTARAMGALHDIMEQDWRREMQREREHEELILFCEEWLQHQAYY